uniref:Secreted protein n=1 Tax=Macrostomum lignano TaxID=282301 RepID=A0A1I8FLH9_9PLAT
MTNTLASRLTWSWPTRSGSATPAPPPQLGDRGALPPASAARRCCRRTPPMGGPCASTASPTSRRSTSGRSAFFASSREIQPSVD